MEMDELAARLEAAERSIAELRSMLDRAQGEATFAGLTLPAIMKVLLQTGQLNEGVARTALDGLLMIMEREQARFPTRQGMFEHVRSRLEATLKLFPRDLPEPR